MLKNMTVLKKILLAFGLVILMLVVIFVVNTVTSLRRTNDLTRANVMSDMLNAANDAQDEINEARVAAETTMTALDAAAAYKNFFTAVDNALAITQELDGYSAQLDGYAADTTATIRNTLNSISGNMQAVQSNDDLMGAGLESLATCANHMSTSATEVFDTVSGLTGEALASGLIDANSWMQTIVNPAQALNASVSAFRLSADGLTIGLDSSTIPGLEAQLDEIEAAAGSLVGLLQMDEVDAVLSGLQADVQTYRDAMASFAEVMLDSEEYIATMQGQITQVIELIYGGVNAISAETNTLLESTMAESNSALFLMLIICVVAIGFSIAIAFVLARGFTRPVAMMQEVLEQVGTTGNLDFDDATKARVQAEAQNASEFGHSMAAFVAMMERLIYIGEQLSEVSRGNLTNDITLLSPEDTMGVALKNMNENLNDMFGEINGAAAQVSTASTEIATGAQTLAQGSTEQASTVEEISASINEITEQSNVSFETADRAARDGEQIREIAAEGSNKMQSMMEAVQQINEASSAIGKVIKVIDDIAFQTNILALNAAVEAARAGEHGKGFAVVADEVRNLAGKSADAAKETANLISASIEKAELGLSISQDTAESLSQIIEGIQKTSESLQAMSEQSASVKSAASQVNLAVDQVAQVVQQNSATSEESAAASEEMSSQAQVLQQLISRFKLKNAPEQQALPEPAMASAFTPLIDDGSGSVIF